MNEPIRNIDLSAYTPEQRATLEEALDVMATNLLWDHDEVERATSRDWCTIARFAQGKPQGDVDGVVADFARLVAKYRREKLVKTPIVEDFERVLGNCRRDGIMGAIVARNGRGKSLTIRDWVRRNPRARAVVVQCPSVCSRGDLVMLLCGAMGLETSEIRQPARERKLFETITSRDMLIIDEAGYLVTEKRKTSPLRLLQDLHDLCGCPVVLVMRPGQWNQLTLGRAVNDDEQLLGRILHRSIIRSDYKRDEVEAIILRYTTNVTQKLRTAVRMLLKDEVGGLRALCRDLALAAEGCAKTDSFDEAFIGISSRRCTAPSIDKLENF